MNRESDRVKLLHVLTDATGNSLVLPKKRTINGQGPFEPHDFTEKNKQPSHSLTLIFSSYKVDPQKK